MEEKPILCAMEPQNTCVTAMLRDVSWPEGMGHPFRPAHDDHLSTFCGTTRERRSAMEQKERMMSCEKKPTVSRKRVEYLQDAAAHKTHLSIRQKVGGRGRASEWRG